jgi:hypothetical protein
MMNVHELTDKTDDLVRTADEHVLVSKIERHRGFKRADEYESFTIRRAEVVPNLLVVGINEHT